MNKFQNDVEKNTSIIEESKAAMINDIRGVIQNKVTENINTKIEDIVSESNKQADNLNDKEDNKDEKNKKKNNP